MAELNAEVGTGAVAPIEGADVVTPGTPIEGASADPTVAPIEGAAVVPGDAVAGALSDDAPSDDGLDDVD